MDKKAMQCACYSIEDEGRLFVEVKFPKVEKGIETEMEKTIFFLHPKALSG